MITTFQLFVAIVVARSVFYNGAGAWPDPYYWAGKRWTHLVGALIGRLVAQWIGCMILVEPINRILEAIIK